VNVIPLQQNRYSPERLNNTTFVGTLSSCRQALKTLTVKLQLAMLPAASVAVHVTVVVPAGNVEPDGGLHTVVITPGQLSVTVGAGKVTAVLLESGQVCAATTVTGAGQVMVGGCVSLTVTVKEHIAIGACRVVSSSQQKSVPVSPAALSRTLRIQAPLFGVPLKKANAACG